MFEAEENDGAKRLNKQLDTLSTRLILDGAASLSSSDFRELSDIAAEEGNADLSRAARILMEEIAPRKVLSIPERTRLLSSKLVEFRRLVDGVAEVGWMAQTQAPAAWGGTAIVAADDSDVASANPLAADVELVREFITEAGEHLTSVEQQMLLLEKHQTAPESLNAVFRGFHTIKGLAGFLEFTAIQSLAHEVETLLDRARKGEVEVSPSLADVVLESMDAVRRELGSIEDRLNGDTPAKGDGNEDLLQRIRRMAGGETAPPGESRSGGAAMSVESVSKVADLGVILQPVKPERRGGDASSVRVDTMKLDQLMNLVGEMVIGQTLIGDSSAFKGTKDTKLQGDLAHLARITMDVQRITTGMRMVPIGIQFQKTSRMVRDLSRRAGKLIEFEASGEDTELDKSIAEELADPLLHMVRNAIDHGIELPEDRVKAGKDATAHIRIAAYHQSGRIVIAVSDDGRGLNQERILAKARQNGLVQEGRQLSENEIFMLIFEAGFSTAENVTDISGRGVGMDVVRRQVQKLRGRIEIESKAGEGTTFYLKLPLTLAIIDSLVVSVGSERYIVPIFSVREMFRPRREMLSTVQGTREMVMVRGGLMPVSRLHRTFDRVPRTTDLTEGTLIVAESEGRPFCLFVDELIGKQEVVIKSLGPGFSQVVGIAGCAILGDGRVGLILDIDGLYKSRVA